LLCALNDIKGRTIKDSAAGVISLAKANSSLLANTVALERHKHDIKA